MKKLLSILAVCIVASSTAQAAVYKFQYTTVIDTLEAGPDHAEVPVASVVDRNTDMRVGDLITGTIVLDTNSYSSDPRNHAWGSEQGYSDGMLAFDMVVDRTGQLIPGMWAALTVTDSQDVNVRGDAVGIVGQGAYYVGEGYEPYAFDVQFGSSSADILTSTAVPGSALSAFTGDFRFIYYYTDPVTGYVVNSIKAGGSLTSLTLLPVPEPGTYAMLLSGLGLLAWRRRAMR